MNRNQRENPLKSLPDVESTKAKPSMKQDYGKADVNPLKNLPDVDKVKKKDSTGGDSELSSGIQAPDGGSLSPIQNITPDEVVNDIADRFYMNKGVLSPQTKIKRYKELVDRGEDPRVAADEVQLQYETFNKGNEELIQPYLSEQDKQLANDAKEFVKGQLPTEINERVSHNIQYYQQQFKDSEKTTEDYEEFKSNVVPLLKEKARYVPLASGDMSEEEILDEFQLVKGITIDNWQDVIDAPKEHKVTTFGGRAQTYRDPEGTEYTRDIQEARREYKQSLPVLSLKRAFGGDPKEVDQLEYGHDLVRLSRDVSMQAEDLTRKLEQGFFEGAGEGLKKYVTGFGDALQSLTTRGAYKKFEEKVAKLGTGDVSLNDLSDEEYLLLHTMSTAGAVTEKFKGQIPQWQEVGEAVGQSIGFMLEMFGTAGIGSSVGKATSSQVLKLSAGRLAPTLSTKMSAKAAETITRAAVQTTAMPSFAKSAMEKYGSGENMGRSIVDGYLDTYTEVLSEKLFTSVPAKGASGSAMAQFWSRTNSAFGNARDLKTLVESGAQELTEEKFAGIIQGWREGDHIYDLSGVNEYISDTRQQATEAMAIGVMSLAGLGSNVTSNLRNSRRIKQLGKSIPTFKEDIDAIISQGDLSMRDIVEEIDNLVMEDGINSKEANPDMVLTNREIALKYAQAKIAREAGTGVQRDEGEKEAIVEGREPVSENDFMQAYVNKAIQSEVQTKTEKTSDNIVYQGKNFYIEKEGESGQPTVILENELDKSIDKMNSGDALTREELESAQESLEEMRGQVKNKTMVGWIDKFLNHANELLGDLQSSESIQSEISNTPVARKNSQSSPVEVNSNASEQSMYDVFVGDSSVGKVQKDVVDGKTTYTAYDNANKKIGSSNTFQDAYEFLTDPNATQEVRVTNTKRQPIEERSDASLQSVREVEVGDKKAGAIQESLVGDDVVYSAFDNKQNKIGDYNNNNDAIAGIVENWKKTARPRRTRKPPKILGKQKVIQIAEIDALRTKLNAEAKAAKKGSLAQKNLMKELSEGLKEAQRKGKINSKQVVALTKRMANVNLENPVMRERFFIYADKVFQKAENIDKIQKADAVKKSVRRSRKDAKGKKNARWKMTAEQFGRIDPRLVEDIDKYIEIGNEIKGNLSSSQVKASDVNQKEVTRRDDVNEYVANEIAEQADKKAKMDAQLIELVTDAKQLSDEEIEAMAAEDEASLKEKIGDMLASAKQGADYVINNKKDPITGESVELSQDQIRIIRGFLDMDVTKLPPKEAVRVIDALNNFVVNYDTAGMGRMLDVYTGAMNAEVVQKRMKAFNFFYPMFGNNWIGEHFSNLPMHLENILRGQNNALFFMDRSGLKDFVIAKTQASQEAQAQVEAYMKQFKSSKPNGSRFNALDNIVERGMFAYVLRRRPDTEENMQQEFDDRLQQVYDSIEVLGRGNKKQSRMAISYMEVFYKAFVDADGQRVTSVEDANIDSKNKEAVQWWIDKWGEYYDPLKETSESYYNKTLDSDYNYTPRQISKVDFRRYKSEDIEIGESAFHASSQRIYDKENPTLMEVRKYKKLPPEKFVNLDFEANMAGLLRAAIIDMKTAPSIGIMRGFTSSPMYKKIFKNPKVGDAILNRYKSVVADTRGKSAISNSDWKEIQQQFSKVGQFAAARTLGSFAQPIKQVIPVGFNTMINAGTLDLSILSDQDQMDVIDRSGQTIAIRGLEAMAPILDAGAMADIGYLTGSQTKLVGQKINNFWLNNLLVKSDVWIARVSWMTYYKKRLKKLGYKLGDIEWKDHEINQEAAAYAQNMLDRQQNISDADLMGEFMKSKDPLQAMMRGVLFPFSSFMFNQKMRIWTDMSTLATDVSSREDKGVAFRSMVGSITEQAVFHFMSHHIRMFMYEFAMKMVGARETEEQRMKREKDAWDYSLQYMRGDLLSPFPVIDDISVTILNDIFDTVDAEIPIETSPSGYTTMSDAFGVYGIGYEKIANELLPLVDMMNGEFTTEFAGRKTTRYLYEEDRQIAINMAKMYALYASGVLPAEFGQFARNIKRKLTDWSITETKLKKHEEKIHETFPGRTQIKGVSRWDVGERVHEISRSPTGGTERLTPGGTTR